MAQTYEKMIIIEEITEPDYRETLMRLIEIGVTPYKIFSNESKEKMDKNEFRKKSSIYCYSKGNVIEEYNKIEIIIFDSEAYKLLSEGLQSKNEIYSNLKILNIKSIINNNKNALVIYTNSSHRYEIKYYINKNELKKDEKSIHMK